MPDWIVKILITAVTLVVTLTVTFIFNKVVALPRELKKQREAEEAARQAQLEAENTAETQRQQAEAAQDSRIASLETRIDQLSNNHDQHSQVQEQLQGADQAILEALEEIRASMIENRTILNERLDRLERREKNALRQKILQEHRLFTDEAMNPMRAWTEMEHHSFFELVHDYESLGGNDYVHSEVIPAMNRLRVIPMSDRNTLYELMSSRRL